VGVVAGWVGGKESKLFFFEKKNQKTFATLAQSRIPQPVPASERHLQKFFGSFFQKRTPSFLFPRRHM
jgi:hypothetical protein